MYLKKEYYLLQFSNEYDLYPVHTRVSRKD